ncbi:MAG: amidase [Burkholderiaceae bacterium]|nr:amidase [Burkholderiaceae bacterium]
MKPASSNPVPPQPASSQPVHFQSATELAHELRAGRIGARELLEHFLARVDRLNPALNAVIQQDRHGARARADAADAARSRGDPLGPLHGVPMTIKESYDFAGTPTTFGVPQYRDNIAATDALAVQRLAAAGANVFGKTNVPIRLADFQSYNEIYGTTDNPWGKGRTPGGSSGGSAAALAAGLTGLEIGSDIGGSIRNPAHFCGVFGHKPTWGLVPGRGHALTGALTPGDISVIGPLGRSAGDLEATLRLMAGPDLLDAAALRVELPELSGPLSALRIGVWKTDPMCPVSAAVAARVEAVAAALAGQGAAIDEAARPAFSAEHSHELFSALLASAMASRLPDDEFAGLVARADKLAPADQGWGARQVRWQTMRLRDWAGVNEARTRLRWAWHEFFQSFDFLITPIMPTTAFPHDQAAFGQRRIEVDGVRHPYFMQTFWAGLAGVAYLPATVIPAGPGPDGLPIGVQIIGPGHGDLRTIQLAQRLEQLGFRFTPPPACV